MSILSDNPLYAFVSSDEALAKGGRGGRGSSGGIEDNWDAPASVKTVMAFDIIWLVFTISQIYMVSKRFSNVQTTASRVPYIIFIVILLLSAIYYLTAAIYTRISSDLLSISAIQFVAFINFIWFLILVFTPAFLLTLIHVRGNIQRAAQGNTFNPIMSQTWKRILDGAWVGLLFVLVIAWYGVMTSANLGYFNDTLSYSEYRSKYEAQKGLSHASYAFLMGLYVNIIAAIITMFVQIKARKLEDPVIKRLLVGVIPFLVILMIESLAAHIISYTMTSRQYDYRALDVATTILDGLARLGIGYVFISTMTLPGVQWNATPGAVPPMMPNHQQGGSSYYDQKQPVVAQQPWQVTPQLQQQQQQPGGWVAQPQPYVQQVAWGQQPMQQQQQQQQQQGWAAPAQPPPGHQSWQPQMQPPVAQQQPGWQPQPGQYQVWNGQPQQQQPQPSWQPGSQPGSQPTSPYVPPK